MEYIKQSCEDFVGALASKAAVPGGGGGSALAGALGMALGSMVGNLTLGKKKYADVQEDIEALLQKAAALQSQLLALVQRDAEVFEPLSRAYGLPRDTPEQQAHKARVMEAALKAACAVPLEIMENCCEAIKLHRAFEQKGTAMAISDVGVGVALCKAALHGASLNVFINTGSMADAAHADAVNQKARGMLAVYSEMADEVYQRVSERLA